MKGVDPQWTLDEEEAWCASLDADPRVQMQILVDLLWHANEDEMSPADRAIARRQMRRLERAIARR